VAVAVDLGVGDEETGGKAVGEANGGELALLYVLLDGGGAQAEGGGGAASETLRRVVVSWGANAGVSFR
jgi:hypothetical protein